MHHPSQAALEQLKQENIKRMESQTIAVDEDLSDSESSYGSMKSEYSTNSLNSSIYDYRYENGRRYQARKAGEYLLPNDEVEQERLDIIHHVYLLVLDDQLTLTPIENPERILDIGTGTGIWAIDAAERYPSAQVIGTDLSPIQPCWVQNVDFHIDDAELEWTYERDSFDLVHIRHLAGGIKDWSHVLKQAFEVCKPGGWVEVNEYEMSVYSDDGTTNDKNMALHRYYDMVYQAAVKNGRDFSMVTKLQPILDEAGFVNSTHKIIKVPMGTWPADKKQKEIGAYILLSAESGFEAFGVDLFTNVLGMSPDESKALIKECITLARSRHIHSYSLHHLYYAQKPLKPESAGGA